MVFDRIGWVGFSLVFSQKARTRERNFLFSKCSFFTFFSSRNSEITLQSSSTTHTLILFTFCASESGHHCGHCHHCGNIKWFCRIMLWSMLQNISFVRQKRNIINCLLLFKFYFKDQRCEDVSMITMMIKHQFHRDDDTEQRVLVIIMMIRVADHHGPWWWWSSSWFMVMILVMVIIIMGDDDDGSVRRNGGSRSRRRAALEEGGNSASVIINNQMVMVFMTLWFKKTS